MYMHLSSDQPAPLRPELPAEAYVQLAPYLMKRAVRSYEREWLRKLRGHGMTIGRWQVLAILSEYDGARLGQLAVMSGAEQAVTSRVVDQMERDGLVRREPVPGDGRAVEVRLTSVGRELFATLLPEADRVVADAMRGIDPATARVLADALTTVIGNLDGPGALAAVPEAPAAVDGRG